MVLGPSCQREHARTVPVQKFGKAMRMGMQPRRSLWWHRSEVKKNAPVQKLGQAMSAGMQPRVAARRSTASRANTVCMCDCVQECLQERCKNFRGVHVRRPQTLRPVQSHVDLLGSLGALGPESIVEETVQLARVGCSEDGIAAEWSSKARRLLRQVGGPGLPVDLSQQIQRDCVELGMVMAKMFPDTGEMQLKLELLGSRFCARWHQDNCICRAIITYNGLGTVYTHDDNVNRWALGNHSSNDHIIRDASDVLRAYSGDVLLMKGKRFPNAVNGLVHRSPDFRYHADGSIMHRLCLKIDVD